MEQVLEELLARRISVKEAKRRIGSEIMDVGEFAKIDIFREQRVGVPEVVYCSGKTVSQIIGIVEGVLTDVKKVILSKLDERTMAGLDFSKYEVDPYPDAGMMVVGKRVPEMASVPGKKPTLGVITAGTADIPVATEAMVCAREMGCSVYSSFDVGVAAIHRLWPVLKDVNDRGVKVLVVAAGREGALPSVVAGLTDAVVIGLPVSSGYGHGGKGEAALSGMLQSCAPILVVNIDAGVVAGLMGAKIAKML